MSKIMGLFFISRVNTRFTVLKTCLKAKTKRKVRLMLQLQSILYCFLFKSLTDGRENKRLLSFLGGFYPNLFFTRQITSPFIMKCFLNLLILKDHLMFLFLTRILKSDITSNSPKKLLFLHHYTVCRFSHRI